MKKLRTPRIVTFTRWCAILMVVPALTMCGKLVRGQTSPDVADTQPEEEDGTAPIKIPITLKSGAKLGTINNGHGVGPISCTGTFHWFNGAKDVTGDVTIDEDGRYIFNTAANWTTADWTTRSNYYMDGFRSWKAGSILGITHNGHSIGVLSGTGTFWFSAGAKEATGAVTADGHGGYIYNTAANWTTTGDYSDGFRLWKGVATWGITHNGHGIGVLNGTGKLEFNESGAHVTGDVAADGKGGFIYSNVKSATTTGDYWDGVRRWKPGAVLGVQDNGKSIGVLSGTGRVDYYASGARVTADVTADGKGGLAYNNVTNGTTTNEYWDGAKVWKTGAVLGLKGKGIRVISGTGRLDYFGSGAHVTGEVTADGKGGFVYSNVRDGTTTSEYWDGTRMWKAGAVLGVINSGKGIGVMSGTVKVD